MPAADFDQKLEQIRDDLCTQFDRTIDMVLRSVEAYFHVKAEQAREVIAADAVIDRVDVMIERSSIPLLCMGVTDENRIRAVLTVVKVNNELERIADCAVNIAEVVEHADRSAGPVPETFRVMANSVIGMLRETRAALARQDFDLAQSVLGYDDAVDRFKSEISMDAQRRVAAGTLDVAFAFRIRRVVGNLERMADHCTNICMQIMYLKKGVVVRHRSEGWSSPTVPDADGADG